MSTLAVVTEKQRPKVLVVDDERTVADTLKLILNNAGYDTRTAYSGETAVEMLRDFEPEILITDVIMPGISGIDAAIKVCEALPACKVLLISGNETAALLHEAAKNQNHDFELLAKPFHPTLLIARMRSAMGY